MVSKLIVRYRTLVRLRVAAWRWAIHEAATRLMKVFANCSVSHSPPHGSKEIPAQRATYRINRMRHDDRFSWAARLIGVCPGVTRIRTGQASSPAIASCKPRAGRAVSGFATSATRWITVGTAARQPDRTGIDGTSSPMPGLMRSEYRCSSLPSARRRGSGGLQARALSRRYPAL